MQIATDQLSRTPPFAVTAAPFTAGSHYLKVNFRLRRKKEIKNGRQPQDCTMEISKPTADAMDISQTQRRNDSLTQLLRAGVGERQIDNHKHSGAFRPLHGILTCRCKSAAVT
eukprot:TRINITY_DN46982_c0_g1_i1.p1 TRINITY_DN46982_c0_g1~~TRINITY_DN46982_c0_g1_i1.p1  ORF type:complete len:113 (+),score=8.76 TRINITY_DN46982_c0_g1_i1:167-505(+)